VTVDEAVVVAAVRTPIGKYGGGLANVPADRLAALVLDECVRRSGVPPGEVDDVVLGHGYQSGDTPNVARLAALRAGLPDSIPGVTLDRRCASGLTAIGVAAMAIATGTIDVALAGGVESMSNAEYYLPGAARWGLPRGPATLEDRIVAARINATPIERYGTIASNMVWAENIARKHHISRVDQDAWALRSHRRAAAAWANGSFVDECVSVPVSATIGRSRSGPPRLFERDEHVRPDTTMEALAALTAPLGGTCTAGNSSGENDGAAALMLTSSARARRLGLESMGTLRSFAAAGVDPRYAGEAVVPAVEKALALAGIALADVGLIEINEAFGVQLLANLKVLRLSSHDHVNVNGSGISLGHPIGCTGARIMVTLLHEMRRRRVRWGLAALCVGGGMGYAAIVERPLES
jgi:acetyl-CoA C-acetyltransferase